MSSSHDLAAGQARRAGRLGRAAGIAGAVVLGGVLLVAAGAKALDPLAFAQQVQAQGLAPAGWGPALAVLALALETALGLLLVLGVRRAWVLWPAVALVAFFLFLTGRDAWRDARGLLPADAACGCFGNLVDRTPLEAFWQDLVLLVPALGLAFMGRERGGRFPAARAGAALAGAAAMAAFAIKAPALPLDDLATRLRPGVRAQSLCAGRGEERLCLDGVVPELAQGRHLVVLADLADAGFGAEVARLNQRAARAEEGAVWVLVAATAEERHAFFWQHGPTFEIRDAPPALLRPLYRRLPRAFEVEDGRVVRTWSGLPPLVSSPTAQALPAAPPA